MLEINSLANLLFMDIGCGNGLFSLATKRLGAKRVKSFDFDKRSVASANELKKMFYPNDKI